MSAAEPIAVVPLTANDFPAVRSIEASETTPGLSDGLIAVELGHEHGFHFGGCDSKNRALVSFILCRLVLGELHVHHLRTLPKQRRQGFAIALVKHALAHAKSRGAARALLEVRASNRAAVGLYEKAGFSKDGVRKKYYPDGDDAVLMSKPL